MTPKPEPWTQTHAIAFQSARVAAAYKYRPTYPQEVFDTLATLMVDSPRRVLDIGCGTGILARPLTHIADSVDAVDYSAAMIQVGKQLPDGDSPKLNWIVSSVEAASLEPPYALITAGASLHWMDWAIVMPRLHALLAPHAMLAILGVELAPFPWSAELRTLIQRYSLMNTWIDADLITELTARGYFIEVGRHTTASVTVTQPIDEYIESFHARASLSHERMSKENSAAFDAELKALIQTYSSDPIETNVVANIVWGHPQP